ncbi:hypothetical protein HUJ04_007402 [Dendroctonus ponderosae]|uniref:Protein sleepless n=1 Tax=Dendroctonus ponderosae TaxID=77166 RepID=A0AAR5QIQ2_DENPD|nr:hypothetical protein HUJ04_007402 [Dendroctonus ponderosae]
MTAFTLPAFVLVLAYGICSAALSCYQCEGSESDCPANLNDAAVADFKLIECHGLLASICTKVSIQLANGNNYSSRNCGPANIQTNSSETFCEFIKSIYSPLISESILDEFSCAACTESKCNV